MKKWCIVALLVLSSMVVSAQQPFTPFRTLSQTTAEALNLWPLNPSSWAMAQCPTCRVEAYVDWMQPTGTETIIAGWGFVCANGRATDRVDVFYEDWNGVSHPQPATLTYPNIDRPDVTTFSTAIGCAAAYNAGFGVVVAAPTAGYRAVIINVWRGGLMHPPIRVALP